MRHVFHHLVVVLFHVISDVQPSLLEPPRSSISLFACITFWWYPPLPTVLQSGTTFGHNASECTTTTSHSSSALSIPLHCPTTGAGLPRDLFPSTLPFKMVFARVPYALTTCSNHLNDLQQCAILPNLLACAVTAPLVCPEHWSRVSSSRTMRPVIASGGR